MKKYTLDNFGGFIEKNQILMRLLSNDEIDTIYKKWRINNGVLFHDYIWLLFNSALIKNGDNFCKDGNEELFYRNNYLIYYSMAHFRREEGAASKTINKLMRLAFESQVQEYKVKGINGLYERELSVIMRDGCCDYYDSISDTKFEIDDFNNDCQIATDKCNDKYGFCRCCISVVGRRNEKGRLVRRK